MSPRAASPAPTGTRVHVAPMASGRDVAANRAAAVAAVRRAADDGARLVVLPEYAAAFDPRGVGADLAEPLDGPFVGALGAAAADGGLTVVAGTTVPTAPGRAANVAVVVDRDGVRATYRKVHLYDAFGQRESERLDAGDPAAPAVVVEVDGLRVGVLICYDLRFPESARRLVDAGADVLAVPAAWAAGPHKADHWETLLRARAIESTAYVLGATQRGPGVTADTCVVDPSGLVVARAEGDAPAVAELSPGAVADVRERNPSLANRRYRVVPGVPG